MNQAPNAGAGSRHILLCTLGASWAVIPEILGWVAPDIVDLYAHHPQRAALDRLRRQHQLPRPDELWVCTTEGEQTRQSLVLLQQWWRLLERPLALRIWTAADTDQLANQQECEHIRELILRAALLASEHCGRSGQLILSLAGGRKTMSADLQTAANLFGAQACLHIVGPEPMPPGLWARTESEKAAQPKLFAAPLSAHLAAALMPLVASTGQRSELLDLDMDGRTVDSANFALPMPDSGRGCSWPMPAAGNNLLHQELAQRQQRSNDLMGNFLAQLASSEHHENWRSLYRLPPARIQTLRRTPIGAGHKALLTDLPKADLHRHLGGCLDLAAQRQVAACVWAAMTGIERDHAKQHVQPLLRHRQWPWDWPAQLQSQGSEVMGQRACRSAAVLLHASDEQLQHNLFAVTAPRVALKHRHARGFAAYERPGELSGSALLCHPAAIAPYADAVVAQARAEGLVYLELRGSPHKYRPHAPVAFLAELRQALHDAGAQTSANTAQAPGKAGPRIGFIWILDRRQPDAMGPIIAEAVTAASRFDGFMLGLDLAGDEGTSDPQRLAPCFLPAFEACLPITIHAGEGESAENIWQATYHLHADRIGHGLTLVQNPQLAKRFRDRGICLELCPTSNREVVGFADPQLPASAGLPAYPLRSFMTQGLALTLCTDNPAISRTNLADEYLAAARMTQDGLTWWQALALMRQAFSHAFVAASERQALIRAADAAVFGLLTRADAADRLLQADA